MPTDLSRLFRDSACRFPCYALVERFEITPPRGPTLYGTLWKPLGPAARRGARRVQVHDADGAELFDTDECFDLANAVNKLNGWLATKLMKEVARA